MQFRQVLGLHEFKLHRHLVDGTVESVWFRQVFGLLRVRIRQVSLYIYSSELLMIVYSKGDSSVPEGLRSF